MAESPSPVALSLTSGRRLAGNVVWNLAGQGVPLLVAVVAIPLLVGALGTERFGVLTLAWLLIGYFTVFDLGLSRALTKLIAERLGAGEGEAVPPLVWTAVAAVVALGALAGLLVAALTPWLTASALRIPAALQSEARGAFWLLALALPVVTSTAALRGVLEAYQAFGAASVVRLAMGLATFLGPLVVLPFSQRLEWVVLTLVVGRVAAWAAHLALCARVVPGLWRARRLCPAVLPALLRFGGWLTVSNLISPLLVYLDRFLIGALLSMAAVAYYAAPYDLVTKVLVVPTALVGVLFPAFATSFAHDPLRAARLFDRGLQYLLLVLFPGCVLLVALAHEGLGLWLGADFARHSTAALQWLTIGVFVNSLAHVPFALVQAAGRPRLTALLHVVELPLYLVVAVWLIGAFGVEGAAAAWALRVSVDALCLGGMVAWLVPGAARALGRIAPALAVALALLVSAAAPVELAHKVLFLAGALLGWAWLAWRVLLEPQERARLGARLGASLRFG
jgi:O-antigen/teichoic acid export membrane protein